MNEYKLGWTDGVDNEWLFDHSRSACVFVAIAWLDFCIFSPGATLKKYSLPIKSRSLQKVGLYWIFLSKNNCIYFAGNIISDATNLASRESVELDTWHHGKETHAGISDHNVIFDFLTSVLPRPTLTSVHSAHIHIHIQYFEPSCVFYSFT